MAFTGQEDHDISLDLAARMTKRYRDANLNTIKGVFFGRDAIEAILAQSNCVGIRVYFALDGATTPNLTAVLVGAKSNEDDIENGVLAEMGKPCPNQCGVNNKLNS